MLHDTKLKLWKECRAPYALNPLEGHLSRVTLGKDSVDDDTDTWASDGSTYAENGDTLTTDGELLLLARLIDAGIETNKDARDYCMAELLHRTELYGGIRLDALTDIGRVGRNFELACIKNTWYDFDHFYVIDDGLHNIQIDGSLVYLSDLGVGYLFDDTAWDSISGVKFSPCGRLMALDVNDFYTDLIWWEDSHNNICTRLVDLETGDSYLDKGGCIGMYKGSLDSIKKKLSLC